MPVLSRFSKSTSTLSASDRETLERILVILQFVVFCMPIRDAGRRIECAQMNVCIPQVTYQMAVVGVFSRMGGTRLVL